MRNHIFPLFCALLLAGLSQSCAQNMGQSPALNPTDTLVMVEPGEHQIIHHKAYTLSYNEEHEQADWVAYQLTRDMTYGEVRRTDDFREDLMVTTVSAQLEDYRRSGYSRGHLVPAGDMKWDPVAMSESFLLSNMSPQTQSFNDGIWNALENKVRQWARYYQHIFVVTGPILQEGLKTIGPNHVSVPYSFYKVIYVPDRHMMIAFIIPQEASNSKLTGYAVTVDYLEEQTGLNFFPTLGEDMESSIDIKRWKW